MPTFPYDGFSFTFPAGWEDITGLRKLPIRIAGRKADGYFFSKSGFTTVQVIPGPNVCASVEDIYAKIVTQVAAECDLPSVAASAPREFTRDNDPVDYLNAIFEDKDMITRISVISNGKHAFVLVFQCDKTIRDRVLTYDEVRGSDEITDCEGMLKSVRFP